MNFFIALKERNIKGIFNNKNLISQKDNCFIISSKTNSSPINDDDKILIYKYKDLGIFKVYVGIVENILNKNYDSIDLDKFNRLSKTFNDFHSMKLDLLKLNNRDVRLFLNNYENTHITFNENYLETIV